MTSTGRCAACKYLRRKCPSDCILSPYFPSNDPQRFAHVHKMYGASNVAKLLQQLPIHYRAQAVDSLHFEAQCRNEDPVYGCVRFISQLQQQIQKVETQLAKTRAEIAVAKSQPHLQHSQLVNLEAEPDLNNLSSEQDINAPMAIPEFDPNLFGQISSKFI